MDSEMPGYLTVTEAAARIGVVPRVVRYRVKNHLLPAIRINDRLMLIPVAAVEQAASIGKLPSGRKRGPKGRRENDV